jgi:hypothetical protein
VFVSIGLFAVICIATVIAAGIQRESAPGSKRPDQALAAVFAVSLLCFYFCAKPADRTPGYTASIWIMFIAFPSLWIYALSRSGAKVYRSGFKTWWRDIPFERAAGVSFFVALLMTLVLMDSKKEEKAEAKVVEIPEVRDSFRQARAYYVQGRYQLCLNEIENLERYVPEYENSRELKTFCEQGRDLVVYQRAAERETASVKKKTRQRLTK